MDRLAEERLRYNQFHTTALCSPTRAALLTGRNHHSAATGVIMELGTGFPGYNSLMPKSTGTFAEILKQNGYNTAWYGKNHNVPDWHTSQAGPFDLWPTGLGFEYFYGFIGGDTNQWQPALIENIKPIEPPHGKQGLLLRQGHGRPRDRAHPHAARDGAPQALAPYYAPGTAHAPHHAPKEWIAKFKGKFDQGWDKVREETFARQKELGIVPANTKLTARPEGLPAWDSLNADQKKVFAHMMEVYAAALAHCDHQMGRILDAIEEMGELDNTLVIYIQGDNGASAEGGMQGLLNEMTVFNAIPENIKEVMRRMDELGGPKTFNHYPVGWAHAMDTPFQWTKQIASHFGGTRNGLVISWPARIKDKGGIRTQFHHVIDIVPTILEAAGVPAPAMLNGVAQKPIEGVSMVYTFDDPKAPSAHRTQYFEMFAQPRDLQRRLGGRDHAAHRPWVSIAKPVGRERLQVGALQRDRGLQPEREPRRQGAGQAPRAAGPLLDRGREVQRAADRQQPGRALRRDDSAQPDPGPHAVHLLPRHGPHPRRQRPGRQEQVLEIKAEVEIPQAGAEGLMPPTADASPATGSTCSRASRSSTTTSPASTATASRPRRSSRPASTRCR